MSLEERITAGIIGNLMEYVESSIPDVLDVGFHYLPVAKVKEHFSIGDQTVNKMVLSGEVSIVRFSNKKLMDVREINAYFDRRKEFYK